MSVLTPETAVMRAVDDLLERLEVSFHVAAHIRALARLGVGVDVDVEENGVGVHILLPTARSAELLPALVKRVNAPGTVRREPGRCEAVGHLPGSRVSVRVTAPDAPSADCRTPAERALGDCLLAQVKAADAQVPAHRRVPRTAAAMRTCLTERTAGAS
ncbi:hypothetical protein ACH4PU_31165 [Streptomyces sp. NPDC021100]|uniref:hypothetical protein n=1 Tax=Streptomyces sp. NPDC021100 TaxID=3365114 RepID=UPI003797B878